MNRDGRRPLFTSSPEERPISEGGNELELLAKKYEPEFIQLVPQVVEAVQLVATQHEELMASLSLRNDNRFDVFEISSPPKPSLEEYLGRIAKFTYISPSSLLGALVLLDRLMSRYPTLYFTKTNIYRFLFVAVRVSSKVVDLRTLNNKNFSFVGGIDNKLLNDLEAKFMMDLRFDVLVSHRDFQAYRACCL